MKIDRAWLFVLIGILVLVAVDRIYAFNLPPNFAYEYSHKNDKAEYKKQKTRSFLIALSAEIEEFVETHEKLIIVLSTVAIASFTAALWNSTSVLEAASVKQGKDMRVSLRISARAANAAKRTAEVTEKQIQAEVILLSMKIINMSDGIPKTEVLIKNVGKTSARSLIHLGGLAFREYPLQRSIWPDITPETVSVAILATDQQLGHSEQAPGPLSSAQREMLASKQMTFYVYGRITYRDIFDNDHFTEYLYFSGQAIGDSAGTLCAYPTGNDAK